MSVACNCLGSKTLTCLVPSLNPDWISERLAILGYGDKSSRESGIRLFQVRHGLQESGEIDQQTECRLKAVSCGTKIQPDPLAATAIRGWNRKSISYAYDGITPQVAPVHIYAAIRRAFATWESAGSGLIFREVPINSSPDIAIGWRKNDVDRSLAGGLVAHADFPPGYSLIATSPPLPLHFDEEESWAVDQAVGKYDIETITLHEIGHCLGLVHSTDAQSVMFDQVYAGFIKRSLSQLDRTNLALLYP